MRFGVCKVQACCRVTADTLCECLYISEAWHVFPYIKYPAFVSWLEYVVEVEEIHIFEKFTSLTNTS
jgi:hypothetical protein